MPGLYITLVSAMNQPLLLKIKKGKASAPPFIELEISQLVGHRESLNHINESILWSCRYSSHESAATAIVKNNGLEMDGSYIKVSGNSCLCLESSNESQ